MFKHSRTHLSDGALLQGLKEHVAGERVGTAEVLADLAEADARKLYLPAAYPSMYAYCVGELRFSEDAAYKRITAARAARRFPAIFVAVAEGRLHLTGVGMLTPHLTPENAEELLAAATNKTKAGIEQVLARHCPRPDVPAEIQAICAQHAPHVENAVPRSPAFGPDQLAPERVAAMPPVPTQPFPEIVERPRVTPLAPERYALQCTVSESTYQKLQEILALLGHEGGPNALPEVLDRALDALKDQLEKSKFAKTARPRPSRASKSIRHIPAAVKRIVWARDKGQCTFVSEAGQRCPAKSHLEFDHIDPVGRGGEASVDRIRLRCRAHNQFEAERVYGAAFMNHKRAEARLRTPAFSVLTAPR